MGRFVRVGVRFGATECPDGEGGYDNACTAFFLKSDDKDSWEKTGGGLGPGSDLYRFNVLAGGARNEEGYRKEGIYSAYTEEFDENFGQVGLFHTSTEYTAEKINALMFASTDNPIQGLTQLRTVVEIKLSTWHLLRRTGKARGAEHTGVCDRRATKSGGMQRRQGGNFIMITVLKTYGLSIRCLQDGSKKYNRKSGFQWGDRYSQIETAENYDALFVGG